MSVAEAGVLRSEPGGVDAGLVLIERGLALLAAHDPAELPGTVALEVSERIASAQARLTGYRLAALRTAQDSGAWALDGSRSMRGAIARREDAALATVNGDLTLAQRLSVDLPLTGAALRDGELSLDKAKLLAKLAPTSAARRQALSGPELGEAFLLEQAKQLDPWSLTRVVTAWGYRVDPAADDAKYRDDKAAHFLEVADTIDGCHVKGLISPEGGQLLRTALRTITGVPKAGDIRTTAQRQAEALSDLARFFLDAGTAGVGAKVRPHLNVSVSYDSLLARADETGVDPATFTETGLPIPRVVLDRLACDCEVSRIVFGSDGEVLDAGRTRRTVTPTQRRAVIARDKTCRGPTCHAPPRLCEVHHLKPWMPDGPTSVRNSGLFCWSCHDWIHAEHLTVTHDITGHLWVFTDRNGTIRSTKREEE